ncbi:hypothetical protein ACFYKX_11320 [Cytobacillus sp. FJAT-54145]|uniref:Uncharacterized protein n=1 Tax=Cytobacillus spartinae TaxID=3299023 RepID=A0ABW6KAE5_9BACI
MFVKKEEILRSDFFNRFDYKIVFVKTRSWFKTQFEVQIQRLDGTILRSIRGTHHEVAQMLKGFVKIGKGYGITLHREFEMFAR